MMRGQVSRWAWRCLTTAGLLVTGLLFSPTVAVDATSSHKPLQSWTVSRIGAAPGTNGSSLSGVSCVGVANCYAVGSDYSGPVVLAVPGSLNESLMQHPVVAHFNGKSWSQISIPLAGALLGIDCLSDVFCVAVGGIVQANGAASTLIERFDGRVWTVVASPNATAPPTESAPPGTPVGVTNWLNSVSCSSVHECMAVGGTSALVAAARSGVSVPLAEHFAGPNWSLSPVPGSWEGALTSVSCAASACTATGIVQGFTAPPFVASGQFTGRYVAGTWQRLNARQATGSGISSLICLMRQPCIGVGGLSEAPYASRLVQGGWRTELSQGPRNSHSQLSGVTCPLVKRCIAVGNSSRFMGRGGTKKIITPLIEARNGSTWQMVLGPRFPDARFEVLNSVSCVTGNRCVAVGYSQEPDVDQSGNAQILVISGRFPA